MAVAVHEVGREGAKVISIDGFITQPDRLVDAASELAPFPPATTWYPGARCLITPENRNVWRYVETILQNLGPLMARIHGAKGLELTEASFSMVTRRPEDLHLLQRIPHYDRDDPDLFAVLHFLSRRPAGGTAFYRHRATGFECISPDRNDAYLATLNTEYVRSGEPLASYPDQSSEAFERTALFDGLYNRALIYQGCLLHSAHIPDDFAFSNDPREGRLTANLFVRRL